MAPNVFANSLHEVIELADNPPDDPQAPVPRQAQEPLVLYIARIPGSRDIFLTPLKPLQKVVTAADVESSLYYVHLATEDDLRLSPPLQQQGFEEHGPNGIYGPPKVPTNALKRKPVASDSLMVDDPPNGKSLAQLRTYKSPDGTAKNGAADQWMLRSSKIKPSSPDSLDIDHPSNVTLIAQLAHLGDSSIHESLRRKPVGSSLKDKKSPKEWILHRSEKPINGPRPIYNRHTKSDASILQPSVGKENIDVRKPMQPTSDKRQQNFAESMSDAVHQSPRSDNFEKPTQRRSAPSSALSLTLIRRYSGFQSNVGHISTCPLDSQNNTIPGSEALPPGSTTLEIMSTGYKELSDASSTLPFRRSLHFGKTSNSSGHPPTTGSNTSSLASFGTRSSATLVRGSGTSEDSASSTYHVDQASMEEASLGSCRFDSLWGGRCEFSSGFAGRSLRCKHTLRPSVKPENVSELRFNLPSSPALGPSSKRPPLLGTGSSSRRSLIFSGHKGSQSSSSVSTEISEMSNGPVRLEDRMGRLDLSLGQERAGGGFGGKQAKLGKLIIEPAGLKMLDLVVAANVAVWWRVYDKLV